MPRTGWAAMAQENGSVTAQLEAWLRIRTASGESAECLLDTGFNGSLMLPREMVSRLGLQVLGRVSVIAAGGIKSIADIAELEIEWLGERRWTEVLVSASEDTLLGTEMLEGTRLTIDYAAHTVTISDEG